LKTCFDTGLLIKAYVPENGSELVDLLLRSSTVPVPFTHLHSVEARTALRLKRFRSELTAEELSGALDAIDADLASGLLSRPDYDLAAVFDGADALSERFAVRTGARSLDILHVAAAIEIRAERFASLDLRQRAVAKAAGMSVVPRSVP
jgi:predicted nucleic acid-binding protein